MANTYMNLTNKDINKMANTYMNYLEQVDALVSSKVQIDYIGMLENYAEDFEDANISMYDDEENASIEVYQWYVVDIYSVYETEETNKLGIFYSEMLGAYIMPVTHFGTMWEGVNPVDLSGFVTA